MLFSYSAGEVVTLPSVDKCVEQFHIIGELSKEKGILGRSNSVIDFHTLESGNPASDSYWENPEAYRRYTLPRNFKPNFAGIFSFVYYTCFNVLNVISFVYFLKYGDFKTSLNTYKIIFFLFLFSFLCTRKTKN